MQTGNTLTASLRCVVALVSLAVAACGPDRGSSPSSASLAAATIAALTVPWEGNLQPSTRASPRTTPALALSQELFEGLTAEAADGSIVPGAAETWTVSEDGRTWTFRLRPNLRWSDGTPLTAAQFVAGLDAARVKDSQAPYSALLHDVTTARAPDSRTVVLEVARAVPYLPAVLALPVAAPQRRAASAGTISHRQRPVSIAVASPRADKIQLERNPHYHSAGSVAIERVTYLTLDDLNTELSLYRTGELDITSEVPNSQIDWLERNLARRAARRAVPQHVCVRAQPAPRAGPRCSRCVVTGHRSRADHRQGDGSGRTTRPELGARGNPRVYARSCAWAGLDPDATHRGRRRNSGAQPANGAAAPSAADPLHGRQRQPSPHGDCARRSMAPDAWRRSRHRRNGMEGLPRAA